jgi:uncharacterized cysteine cluster protein YcgN (CxxCxxCC family)
LSSWWDVKPLDSLTREEWESLCDGCAKCCLHKLQDADTDEVFYTKVRCRYLDEDNCRCSDYDNRSRLMPNCIQLSPDNLDDLAWLPATCAYRLRFEGNPLPDWHPLVSGRSDSVHTSGISIRGRAISDEYVHPDGFEEHIITWVE